MNLTTLVYRKIYFLQGERTLFEKTTIAIGTATFGKVNTRHFREKGCMLVQFIKPFVFNGLLSYITCILNIFA
jgi:hypothetical protein